MEETNIPVQECSEAGKPGYRWGDSGKCYVYRQGDDAARRKAKQQAYIQGSAVQASQERRGEKPKAMPSEFLIEKQFASEFSAPLSISPEIMAQINARTREPVPPEQIYVTEAKLANDQYDRSYERFRPEHLRRFAETINGKALLPGHDRSKVPLGRWLAARVEKDREGVTHLVVPFYVDAKSETARLIRLGIATDVSINFKAAGRHCDLCDEPYDGCPHDKGHTYDGKVCTITYSGDPERYEALEGSLVWLACQNGAAVVGAKAAGLYGGRVLEMGTEGEDVTKDEEVVQLKAKVAEQEDEIGRLKACEERAKDGDAYRNSLRVEYARKMAAVAGDTEEGETGVRATMLKTVANADVPTLQVFLKMADEQYDRKFPPQTQSRPMGNGEGHSVPAPPGEPAPMKRPFDPHASLKKGY